MTPFRTTAALLLLTLSAPALAQAEPPTLARGIAQFNNFGDAKAKVIFEQVLLAHPSSFDAAKAHVYLGLIAVNALDSNRARAEFMKALNITTRMTEGTNPGRASTETSAAV